MRFQHNGGSSAEGLHDAVMFNSEEQTPGLEQPYSSYNSTSTPSYDPSPTRTDFPSPSDSASWEPELRCLLTDEQRRAHLDSVALGDLPSTPSMDLAAEARLPMASGPHVQSVMHAENRTQDIGDEMWHMAAPPMASRRVMSMTDHIQPGELYNPDPLFTWDETGFANSAFDASMRPISPSPHGWYEGSQSSGRSLSPLLTPTTASIPDTLSYELSNLPTTPHLGPQSWGDDPDVLSTPLLDLSALFEASTTRHGFVVASPDLGSDTGPLALYFEIYDEDELSDTATQYHAMPSWVHDYPDVLDYDPLGQHDIWDAVMPVDATPPALVSWAFINQMESQPNPQDNAWSMEPQQGLHSGIHAPGPDLDLLEEDDMGEGIAFLWLQDDPGFVPRMLSQMELNMGLNSMM